MWNKVLNDYLFITEIISHSYQFSTGHFRSKKWCILYLTDSTINILNKRIHPNLCFLKLFSTINGINQKNRWTKLTFQTPPWSWRTPWCPSSDRWAAHPAGLCGRHSQPSPTSCRDCRSASPSSCQNQTMVESTLYNHIFDLHTLRIFKFIIYIFKKIISFVI